VTGLTFLMLFLVIIALLTLGPLALRRFHVPAVSAMMLVGVLIGPNALDLVGLLSRYLSRGYPPGQLYSALEAFGFLGLVFLMTLAGLEVDFSSVRRERGAVASLSILTFLVPGVLGYLTYALFLPGDGIGKLVYASLFASHSVGIVFPVIRELGVVRTRFGVAVLVSTVLTDLASLVLFAVAVQLQRHRLPVAPASLSVFDRLDPSAFGGWFFVLFALAVVGYTVVVLLGLPAIARRAFARLRPEGETRLLVFLLGVLAVVALGEVLGISIIVGAFVAGMAFARTPGFRDGGSILPRRIEGIGHGLLIPFTFLVIGMKTDLRVLLAGWEGLTITLVTVATLVAGKIGSGWLALRLVGFDSRRSFLAGLMTVPQLSATLAAAAVALELGMLTPVFFNAIVGLSVLTTIPVPTLVRYLIHRWQVRFEPCLPVEPVTLPPEHV
jgi:Kef-type K+ transport system membrane component KefB